MSEAVVRWASGPVIRARTRGLFRSYEALAVGELGLLGEVIQLDRDEIVAQVYEDTTGMRPGDRVVGTGLPLSVRGREVTAKVGGLSVEATLPRAPRGFAGFAVKGGGHVALIAPSLTSGR